MTKGQLIFRVQHYGKDATMEAMRVELNEAHARIQELERRLGSVSNYGRGPFQHQGQG